MSGKLHGLNFVFPAENETLGSFCLGYEASSSAVSLSMLKVPTIGNTTSSSRIIEFGVPRGTILGPLLFILYTGPIHDIISAHNLDCMFYADDSQLYITIDPRDQRLASTPFRSVLAKSQNGTRSVN